MAEVDARPHEDERTSRILDAVGEVVLERGISGLTTALVARRARVAPGKFYELFADKYAVLEAATERNARRYFDALQVALADGPRDMHEIARASIDTWIDFCRQDPSFRVLRFLSGSSGQAAQEDLVAGAIREWMDVISREYSLDLPEGLHRQLTLTAKFIIDPVDYAFRLDPVNGDEAVLAQVRRVLAFLISDAQSEQASA